MATQQQVIDFVENWRVTNNIEVNAALSEAQIEQFAADLQQQVSDLSFESPKPGASMIAYNGSNYGTGVPAWELARATSECSNGTLVYISDFDAGKLINNDNFNTAVANAVGDPDLTYEILHGTKDAAGNRTPYGAGGVLSLDDYVSKRIMMEAEGNVVSFTTEMKDYSVFTQTELQTIIDNPNVTSINGIPKSELTSILNDTRYGFTYAERMDLVREAIAVQSRIDLSTVSYATKWNAATSKYEIIWTDAAAKILGGSCSGMPIEDGVTKFSCAELIQMSKTDMESSSLRLAFVQGKFAGGEFLNKVGWAAALLSTAYDAYQYKEAYDAGDKTKCKQIAADWCLETAGSVTGGAAGWFLTARTLAMLGVIGVEAGAAGIFIAGIIGAYAGYKAGEFLMEELRDLFHTAEGTVSPLILDLDGDGVETTSLADSLNFDHDNNGFAEQSAWVGADDGLLVRDINGNGIIDDGTELFGNNTILANGQKAANGFAALAELDSNSDGTIDANDTAFNQLLIWKDADGDGITDAGELITLADAGVVSINTAYNTSTAVDAQGNEHKQTGAYTRTDGTTASINDVWFKMDAMYSTPTELLEETGEISVLPDLMGSGNVYSLHQAMLRDSSNRIQSLVEQFAAESDSVVRREIMTNLIYAWAGVADIDPNSRAATRTYGNAIGDARKLEALEEFIGEEYSGTWCCML